MGLDQVRMRKQGATCDAVRGEYHWQEGQVAATTAPREWRGCQSMCPALDGLAGTPG